MTFFAFVKKQFSSIPSPTNDVTGQVIIVMGANVGSCSKAARHFGRLRSAKVILGVWGLDKGEKST